MGCSAASNHINRRQHHPHNSQQLLELETYHYYSLDRHNRGILQRGKRVCGDNLRSCETLTFPLETTEVTVEKATAAPHLQNTNNSRLTQREDKRSRARMMTKRRRRLSLLLSSAVQGFVVWQHIFLDETCVSSFQPSPTTFCHHRLTQKPPTSRSKSTTPRRSHPRDIFPRGYYNFEGEGNKKNKRKKKNKSKKDTKKPEHPPMEFTSALCIVPPHWDRLQRARHYARDSLFHTWPPAIRLFHPFYSATSSNTILKNNNNVRGATQQHTDAALEVATAVEKLKIKPFTVTLDQWVIVPNVEAIQAEWSTAESNPQVMDHEILSNAETDAAKQDAQVKALIERETQIGIASLKKRQASKKRKIEQQEREAMIRRKEQLERLGDEYARSEYSRLYDEDRRQEEAKKEEAKRQEQQTKQQQDDDDDDFERSPSPEEVYQLQQQQYEESGGPCILCLEPDAESKKKIIKLRQSLQDFFNAPSYFSPSSAYSWTKFQDKPNGNDDDITSDLMDLMGYRPLLPISSFETLTSAMEVARRLKGLWGDPLTFQVQDLHLVSCRDEDDATDSELVDPMQRMEWRSIPWGCNAKIMLLGNEMPQDDSANQDMVQQLVENGTKGGMDISEDYTILDDEEETPLSSIELWLEDDDDFDEGTSLVIGRTMFFTGDQRTYKEMPVSSVVDHKDRSLGEQGMVSGLARRRRTSSRKTANAFEDGQYGRRDVDYLPWNKQEKAKRTNYVRDGSVSASYYSRKNNNNMTDFETASRSAADFLGYSLEDDNDTIY